MSPWFQSPAPREDPAVAAVEEILDAATASGRHRQAPQCEGRLEVQHAVWLCACETMDDSPVWLIYDTADGGIGWQRLPDGSEPAAVVHAEHLSGGHPSPDGVLEWLRGDAPDPWSGWGPDFPEHAFVFEALRRKICLE